MLSQIVYLFVYIHENIFYFTYIPYMKLQEFFDSQKHITCTDIDKLDLYQSILYKKSKKHSLKRMSFIPAKYAVYSMFLMILLVGVYGVYFINNE